MGKLSHLEGLEGCCRTAADRHPYRMASANYEPVGSGKAQRGGTAPLAAEGGNATQQHHRGIEAAKAVYIQRKPECVQSCNASETQREVLATCAPDWTIL